MTIFLPGRQSRRAGSPLILLVLGSLLGVVILPIASQPARGDSLPDHLVISEVVTGGASASDEFIELYNPGPGALPLEGLELVYVSASGLTVSRRAAWGAGAPEIPPHHHVLVAHELGTYASIADVLYASGMAATGGSVALRIQGAESPIDAVGWGSAASDWLEGRPAPAPAAGASLERLPGGASGSTQDTDDNLADFIERVLPEPQNAGSPPTPDPFAPPPTATPSPSATAPAPTSTPTPAATVTPAPTPGTNVIPVATARALPDGTSVTVEVTALTGSTFGDGGGYVADASGGIAVLLSSGSFDRGTLLRVTGTVDDRFAQRTIRAAESQVSALGPGSAPEPAPRATGSVGESVEGSLVRISGSIAGAPTALSSGVAYDVDDGSGAARVVVGSTTGIGTAEWTSGSVVDLVGVVGQRDSSGTGAAGYRVQPRDPGDVIHVGPALPSASPSASPSPGHPTPSPTAAPDGTISIAQARAAPKNARVRVRGTVTMPAGVVDPVTAVIQDGTAAIVLRLGSEVGRLARGELVQVDGMRSTLAGMETLRVTVPPSRLGVGPEPEPEPLRTGDAEESLEAALVTARGGVVANARRVASGTVSFEIDDGSGPLRVYLASALAADPGALTSGRWVTVTGVLGQETTGAQPLRGYRVWPRSASEVQVGAGPTGAAPGSTGGAGSGSADGVAYDDQPVASLAGVGGPHLAGLRIGATLVHGPWDELGIAGLLWDGERLVAVDARSSAHVQRLLGDGRPPVSLELGGLRATGTEPATAAPMVVFSDEPGDLAARGGTPVPPAVELPDGSGARWISVVGRIGGSRADPLLRFGTVEARLDLRCEDATRPPAGTVSVTGIGLSSPPRIMVPCGAVRRAPVPGRGELRLATGAEAPREPVTAAMTLDAAPSPRAPAALLLGAGALMLGAAAATRRRGGDADPEPDAATAPSDAVEGTVPRALSLVSVPHERGSP